MHFTVAIATWNRAALLAETLGSLSKLSAVSGATWDVLVCDNNSSDQTKSIVEHAMTDEQLRRCPGFTGMRYLFEARQGKSNALNHMLREATGVWVLFLDDDVIVDPHWLEALVAAIARYPKAAVLGGAVLPRTSPSLTKTQHFLLEHFPGAYGVTRVLQDCLIEEAGPTPGGANMAVRRDVAMALTFDTSRGMFQGRRIAGEDMMMALGIMEQGHEGWMIAQARVLHHTPDEIVNRKRLFQWQMGIGRVWAIERGKPAPGRWGVPWWAWREMIRRWVRQMILWRPWATRAYHDALVKTAQYWGYLRSK